MHCVIKLSKPLLNKANPNAKLITTLMNWTAGTDYGQLINAGGSKLSLKNRHSSKSSEQLLRELMSDVKNPLEAMTQMMDGQFIINLLIKYLAKHPEVFEEYLRPFEERARKVGVKRATANTIVSLVPDFENEVIDNLNDTTFERYIEWQLCDNQDGQQDQEEEKFDLAKFKTAHKALKD